ncbi:MAG: 7-cyano-7-deazaguanine synthase QueC [Candidatus Margulisiibacteriota bacterium]|nr:MAG: 7-cyano-7-deazaguanine synthase QueC [Candidatus Margulisbacteria bacterium GWD2_39_127]OGI02887.1 MAG: 7-cyano-7-deazaguanine synthase QueC [Candidatus Margulisbacteria bacterium GWF2_38_17]OGI06817.1 MAG: 7-cyano-7-deazaguanine synthase QueC [Candidatus Margulisbacteria bacterium GWE2_39_32]PZM83005.1 MAG: 7-cyano-7-deazaguanine synthase QueC [Candidatus Margulisiibacteriota bacterium]HAR62165.1 7-cyano-7-deazaguanine synthase QueC [Candidatus Margulisiibacteriota bacterium]
MKALVLLSAGLDSLVNMAQALDNGYELEALTFDYGQKAAQKELEHAANICTFYSIPHRVIELPWLAEVTTTSLVASRNEVPVFNEERINDTDYINSTAKAVWVPNRNGTFINIAASVSEAKGIDEIIVGFNKEEAATFPDNTKEYLEKVNDALAYSTLSKVKVISFTTDFDKIAIVNLGKRLAVPFKYCWPCYHNGAQLCGRCESCVRYFRALSAY